MPIARRDAVRLNRVERTLAEPTLAEKVAFLSRPEAYPDGGVEGVVPRETHMSWVFLVGTRVYKLKKPVRFPYLDFSTLGQRQAACEAELRLNRRLAPDVYLGLAALTWSPAGLAIGGSGRVVDWLVVMRRLDERHTLENAILEGRVERRDLDRLAAILVAFYRRARPVPVPPAQYIADRARNLSDNCRLLLEPRLALPAGLVRSIERAARSVLLTRPDLLAARPEGRHIVDGHGDLRPEHIWLNHPIRIIDCLEFNARLRAVDPWDEIAYLDLECERLGAAWTGTHILHRMRAALSDDIGEELFLFYRCFRALLRARLAIAHLLEPRPRMPEKWPRRALDYLHIAAADARRLGGLLRTPGGRRGRPLGEGGEWLRPTAAPPGGL
jgi:aminoglycoside phosphotransferase family enzyme